MKDYASPIEMITNNIIKSDEEQLEDCMLFSVERKIGFKVDKEELIKALEYDRKQYEKGFEDGLKSAVDWISVNEKYPDKNGEYLVTVKRGYMCLAIWLGYVENWSNVTAWMPLPKPYVPDTNVGNMSASPTGAEKEG